MTKKIHVRWIKQVKIQNDTQFSVLNQVPPVGVYLLFIGSRQNPHFSLKMTPMNFYMENHKVNRCPMDKVVKIQNVSQFGPFPENRDSRKREFKVPNQCFSQLSFVIFHIEFLGDSYELLIGVLSRIFQKPFDSQCHDLIF